MSILIPQIDKALAQYYESKNKKDDYFDENKVGLFTKFCDDNGFDEDEQINDEMAQQTISDCILIDAFDDTFPGLDDNFGKSQRNKAIFDILKRCIKNPDSFGDDAWNAKAFEVLAKDWVVTKKDTDKAVTEHKQQAKQIFDEGMIGDKSILKLVAISHKLNKPYLQYLADMYTRDMIIMMTKKQAPPSYSPETWARTNKHILALEKENQKLEAQTFVTAAIKSWFHRINPIIILNSSKLIQDSLQHVCQGIGGMVEFVSSLTKSKTTVCPFQYDGMIAFDKVKQGPMGGNFIEADASLLDDNDDTDDDEPDDAEFYDCLDNIPKKLDANKCLYIRKKANDVIEDEKKQQSMDRSWRFFGAQFSEFKNERMKQKYKGKEWENYPQKHRFCSVLDRRSANKVKDICDGDEAIFYEPPNDCNSFPKNAHSSLFYFDTSRNCVLPGYVGIDSKDTKMSAKEKSIKTTINSLSPNKGGTLLFSFHVESADEIRCYLYVNGQAFRFLPKDIRLVLPKLFDMTWGNNKQWIDSKDCDALIDKMDKQLRDLQFKAFLKSYRNKLKV